MPKFEEELRSLINKNSMENASNTPDFILAQFMSACLQMFNTAVQQRETWYGRDARPSGLSSDSPEPKIRCSCVDYPFDKDDGCKFHPKPKDSEKWCSHLHKADNGRYYINGVMVGEGEICWKDFDDIWDICPVKGCHAPRPAPAKTLAERLADEIHNIISKTISFDFEKKSDCIYLAEQLVQHFNQNKV